MMQLPEDFVREARFTMGEERFHRFLEAFHEEAPTSIRLNPRNQGGGPFVRQKNRPVPWCEEGFYLEGRPQFTFDPLFHAGCYYVQEAASMFISHVLQSVNSTLSTLHSQLIRYASTPSMSLGVSTLSDLQWQL